MGSVSRALANGSSYTFDGVTYHLSGWCLGVQGDYELYLEGIILAKSRLMRNRSSPEDLAVADPYAITVRDINAGLWSFGSSLCGESLRNEAHFAYAVLLMLRESGKNGALAQSIDYELAKRMVAEDSENLVSAIRLASGYPNANAPAQTT